MTRTVRWLGALLVAAILAVGAAPAAAAANGSNEVTIWFFWGQGCPHCAAEHVFVDDLSAEMPQVVVQDYEVWHDPDNLRLFQETAHQYGIEPIAVPTTFLGEHVWIGFDERVAEEIRAAVEAAINDVPAEESAGADEPTSVVEIPIVGSVDVANIPLVTATVAIGLVDGLNPCSLWALSVLLALVVRGGSRTRIAVVGGTFLLVTAALYGAFIMGAYGALSLVSHLDWVRIAVAAVALVAGLINVKDYVWFRAGPSLSTPESGKSALIRRMRGVAFADRAPLVLPTHLRGRHPPPRRRQTGRAVRQMAFSDLAIGSALRRISPERLTLSALQVSSSFAMDSTDLQYTPGEVAERFGLTLDTLRYYEREGLLTEVERAPSGHRRYRPSDVELLDLVRCLRDTDMPISRLREFAELVRDGDHTIPARLDILRTHDAALTERIAELRSRQEAIQHKIAYYEGVLAKETE